MQAAENIPPCKEMSRHAAFQVELNFFKSSFSYINMAFLPLAILILLDFIVMHWTFLPVETRPSVHTLQQHANMNWFLKSESASVLFVTTWTEGLICTNIVETVQNMIAYVTLLLPY